MIVYVVPLFMFGALIMTVALEYDFGSEQLAMPSMESVEPLVKLLRLTDTTGCEKDTESIASQQIATTVPPVIVEPVSLSIAELPPFDGPKTTL